MDAVILCQGSGILYLSSPLVEAARVRHPCFTFACCVSFFGITHPNESAHKCGSVQQNQQASNTDLVRLGAVALHPVVSTLLLFEKHITLHSLTLRI